MHNTNLISCIILDETESKDYVIILSLKITGKAPIREPLFNLIYIVMGSTQMTYWDAPMDISRFSKLSALNQLTNILVILSSVLT